jgi:hypothetical protein
VKPRVRGVRESTPAHPPALVRRAGYRGDLGTDSRGARRREARLARSRFRVVVVHRDRHRARSASSERPPTRSPPPSRFAPGDPRPVLNRRPILIRAARVRGGDARRRPPGEGAPARGPSRLSCALTRHRTPRRTPSAPAPMPPHLRRSAPQSAALSFVIAPLRAAGFILGLVGWVWNSELGFAVLNPF